MSEPVGVTFELPHHTRNCCGAWVQEIHKRRIYWRCTSCRALCYDAPGVLDAIATEHAMGKMLEALARAGKGLLLESE